MTIYGMRQHLPRVQISWNQLPPHAARITMCDAVHQQVVEVVRGTLLSLGVAAERVSDLNVPVLRLLHDDDVTFDFIPEVQKALGVEVSHVKWEYVQTVQDVVELLYHHKVRPSWTVAGRALECEK